MGKAWNRDQGNTMYTCHAEPHPLALVLAGRLHHAQARPIRAYTQYLALFLAFSPVPLTEKGLETRLPGVSVLSLVSVLHVTSLPFCAEGVSRQRGNSLSMPLHV